MRTLAPINGPHFISTGKIYDCQADTQTDGEKRHTQETIRVSKNEPILTFNHVMSVTREVTLHTESHQKEQLCQVILKSILPLK